MQPSNPNPVATKLILTARVRALNLQRLTQALLESEQGSAAIEYALILGLVGSVLLASVNSVGKASIATFSNISTAIEPAKEHSNTVGAPAK